MIEDTPPHNNVPSIAEVSAPQYTHCDTETTQQRAVGCRSCSFMIEENGITRCQQLLLDINLIISADEISCPEGVW